MDSADDSRALAARIAVTYPLLADPGAAVARAYGVADADNKLAIPAVFVVLPNGTIGFSYVGEGKADRPPEYQVLGAVRQWHGSR